MQQSKNYLTVTALTKYIRYKFDNDKHLKQVLLKGEISNFKHHQRGHFYLTLKDDGAQIDASMFNQYSSRVAFAPKDGDSVIVEGYITVYEPQGKYIMYITNMQLDGVGNLYLEYEKLKKKLAQEGLFNKEHKKPIPKYPKAVGVCTSETGAAIQDIINTINRRFPLTKVIIYPTIVQGENSKGSIVRNIEKANRDNLVDVLIVGRGGGSIEDMWSFNEEEVAYAIFNSKIPIISSVGHETDTTIADYVADLRAPTPTAGAELAVPDKLVISNMITDYEARLKSSILKSLNNNKDRIKKVEESFVFKNPTRIFDQYQTRLDRSMDKFQNSYNAYYERLQRRLTNVNNKLLLSSPKALYDKMTYKLNTLNESLNFKYKENLMKNQNKFRLSISKLELLNPLSIMDKGYSMTKVEGKVLNSVKNVNVGQNIDIYLKDGYVNAKINNIKEK